jgi:hypothetical protein
VAVITDEEMAAFQADRRNGPLTAARRIALQALVVVVIFAALLLLGVLASFILGPPPS